MSALNELERGFEVPRKRYSIESTPNSNNSMLAVSLLPAGGQAIADRKDPTTAILMRGNTLLRRSIRLPQFISLSPRDNVRNDAIAMMDLVHVTSIHKTFLPEQKSDLKEIESFLSNHLTVSVFRKHILSEGLWRNLCFIEGFRNLETGSETYLHLPFGEGLTKRQLVEESFKQHDSMMASIT